MKYMVTGGAGFIGSNIVDVLIKEHEVVIYDNLSSGKEGFISHHMGNERFEFVKADLLDLDSITKAMKGVDFVFHIAANPDVRYGVERTRTDLEQGPIATHNLLEAMRINKVKNIAFSSTSTVYGEVTELPTPEDYGPMLPISLYGASKLACEGLISSYSHSFDMNSWMFRFANVIGHRGTHGVLVDFIEKLKKDSKNLEILGDGSQKKSYLLVQDCVDAMILATRESNEQVNLFNLGCEDWIGVDRIAEILVEEIGLEDVSYNYTGGSRGWVGDVPKALLSIGKIKALGWSPKHTSEEAVRLAARSLVEQLW